jgi:predicted MFS family arabinose efflux permease
MDGNLSSLRPAALPLTTIFLAQALMTSGAYAFSVIAPVAAMDLDMDPDSVGFLASTLYLVAMLTGLGSQSAIVRWGAMRTFQGLLVLSGLGILSLMAGHLAFAFLGAVLIGIATGPMNPCGSFVLSRVTPPTWQPLVFSLKQCGTPVGGMVAGGLLPPLALLYDWRLALAFLPVWALLLFVFAPYGGIEVGRDARRSEMRPGSAQRPRGRMAAVSIVLASLRDAFATPALRSVVMMGCILGVCQLGLAAYFVVYLWSETGMSPVEAGQVFVVFHVAGVVARIVMGAIAERYIPTRFLLQALGVLMAVGTACAALFEPTTPLWWIYLVTVVLGLSGNGWVGLFFAELARLAPSNVASITGGAQFAMYIGIFVGPLLYGVMLKNDISHAECLAVFAALALLTALMPLLLNRPAGRVAG